MKTDTSKPRPIAVLALLLAWLAPGAGHVYLGRPIRGVIIFLAIAATFWSGVAVGGVMTVDYHSERWWFAAQILTGVHGIVGWRRQATVYRRLASDSQVGPPPPAGTPDRADWESRVDRKLAADGVALACPTDTVARAYTGVAGLLNLMCMFDAVMLSLLGEWGEPAAPEGKAGRKTPQEDER